FPETCLIPASPCPNPPHLPRVKKYVRLGLRCYTSQSGRSQTHSFVATSNSRFRFHAFNNLMRGLQDPFVAGGLGIFYIAACQSPRDPVQPGDFGQAEAASPVPKDGGTVYVERTAADMSSFELGAAHAGADALDNQVPLQLSDSRDDDDHGAAERADCVEVFAEGNELDIQAVEFIYDLEEVPGRSRQSITRPDEQDIELASPCVGQQLIKPRPLRPGAADAVVRVDLGDLEAALGGHLLQVEALIGWVLLQGTDAEIQSSSLHLQASLTQGASRSSSAIWPFKISISSWSGSPVASSSWRSRQMSW